MARYEKWLVDPGRDYAKYPDPKVTAAGVKARLRALAAHGLAVMFGEVGNSNNGRVLDPTVFLRAAAAARVTVVAWLHTCSSGTNSLLAPNCTGTPSAWGAKFFAFAKSIAELPPAVPPPRPRRVFLHYLPWFRGSGGGDAGRRQGWCAEGDASCATNASRTQYVGAGPLIGEYDQLDADVLEYHLLLAHAAGVDGLVVNVNPSDAMQVTITRLVVDTVLALRSRHAWFTQQLVLSYDDHAAAGAAAVARNLELVRDLWLGNATAKAAFFVDAATGSRPLLFWSEANVTAHWAEALRVYGCRGSGVAVVARNAVNFGTAHGNFAWIGPPSTAATVGTHWGEQYLDDFEWIMGRQSQFGGSALQDANTLAMGAAWPGFDDANVPASWNGGVARKIARTVDAGDTLALTFQHAIDRNRAYAARREGTGAAGGSPTVAVDMPWLQVATFNDWPEGTHVEPQRGASPYRALEQVQNYTAVFKASGTGGTGGTAAVAASAVMLRVPACVYQRRRGSPGSGSVGDTLAAFGAGRPGRALELCLAAAPSSTATTAAAAATATAATTGAATGASNSSCCTTPTRWRRPTSTTAGDGGRRTRSVGPGSVGAPNGTVAGASAGPGGAASTASSAASTASTAALPPAGTAGTAGSSSGGGGTSAGIIAGIAAGVVACLLCAGVAVHAVGKVPAQSSEPPREGAASGGSAEGGGSTDGFGFPV